MKKGDGELFLFWRLPALGVTWVLVFMIFPGFAPPMSPHDVGRGGRGFLS
jgi:hypothetical protein